MVTISALWLPVLISAVLCWIAGAILWMVLPHHNSDYARLPDQEAARGALREATPGQYTVPHLANPSKMTDDERRLFEEGPLAYITVVQKGMPNMGKNLALQMVYLLVVAIMVAYVASQTLPAGVDYLKVFQVTGTVAWMGFGFAMIQESVWFGKPWSYTAKVLGDALVYALLTAGVFGWLWPGGS